MFKLAPFLFLLLAVGASAGGLRGQPSRSLQEGDPSMSAAMQAASSLTGFVKDQVEGLLNDVQKAEDAVNEWSTQYSELAQINLPEYQATVAGATVDLSDARESGVLVLSSLEQLVGIGLKNLDSAFSGSDPTAIKNAIDNTSNRFS